MSRAEKEAFVSEMSASVADAAGVLFLDFTGLTVADVNKFRRALDKADVSYRVVKNSLMKRVLAGGNYDSASAFLKGSPTGVVSGNDDPVAAAKIAVEFAEDCENLKIKGGLLDQKVLNAAEVEALSKLPGRRELQAAVVSTALGAGRRVIGQMMSPGSRIAGAIEALVEKGE